MSAKKLLVAASASLAGLLFLACAGSPALAQTQRVLSCFLSSTPVAPGASTVATCVTNMIPLSSITPLANDLRVDYVDGDAGTAVPGVVINSVEVTLNVNNAANQFLDFMDVALSPYANVAGGGGISSNVATFGALNSPNIDLLKSSIFTWTGLSSNNVNFELQVFVTNNTAVSHNVVGSLHVIVDINTLV
jgi:hypothetical protein